MSALAAAPPHDVDAEASVLGAVLLSDRVLVPLVADVGLVATDFYRERHRLIYRSMIRLSDVGENVDALTVTADLRETGDLDEAGGSDYVHGLVGQVPSLANTRQYGQIVKENALLRELLVHSHDTIAAVANREGDARELVERTQARALELSVNGPRVGFRELGDVLHDELDKLEDLSLRGVPMTGVPAGLSALDEMTGGFQPGNLIVIGGRPSMGKSALVTKIAADAASAGHVVAMFSLEMSQSELSQRFIATRAKIASDLLRKGKVDRTRWPAVMKAAQWLHDLPIHIDDSSDMAVGEIRAQCRRLHARLHARHGVGLGAVIVDYLQLLRPANNREGRVEQVAQMSRGLKALARELDVPVIALSQLSREVERRHPPRPVLSDLRDSGSIEQDADVVIFLYRDEYYTRDKTERPGEADLIVAKHRNGPVGEVAVAFIDRYPTFENARIDPIAEQTKHTAADIEDEF